MKTTPLHIKQKEELEQHAHDKIRAIHWEQGTGKTWLALATAEEL